MKKLFTSLLLLAAITLSAQQAVTVGPGRPPKGWNKYRQTETDKKLKQLKRQAGRFNEVSDPNVKILDVPAFSWTYGCSPTSAGMLVGYYDRNGYPNLYTGDENNGVCPMTNEIWGTKDVPHYGEMAQCPFIASEIHVKDFWTKLNSGEDPFFNSSTQTQNWEPHWNPLKDVNNPNYSTGTCLADFMGTSQGYIFGYIGFSETAVAQPLQNIDGSSKIHSNWADSSIPCHSEKFGDLTYGTVLYIQSKGYKVDNWFNQAINYYEKPNSTFTFERYCEEIDAGRPVLIIIIGHNILGVGYDKTNKKVYLHNTWDYSTDVCDWAGEYRGRQMGTVGVIQLAPATETTTRITVKASSDDMGQVYPSGSFHAGSTQTIKAVAKENYQFMGWTTSTGNCVLADPNAAETTVRVNGGDTIIGKYQSTVYYDVTVKSAGNRGILSYYENGSWHQVDGEEYKQSVLHGTDCKPVRVTQLYANCPFTNWTGDYTGTDNPLTITNVQKAMTVTAVYEGNCIVSFNTNGNGSISGETTQTVPFGNSSSSVTAVADNGHTFTGWSGGYTGTENPLVISNISSDLTVTANFTPNQYTVNFAAGKNGTITGETTQTVSHGSYTSAITAQANECYVFTGWTGDYTGTENPLVLDNVSSDMTVTANFEIDQSNLVDGSNLKFAIANDSKRNRFTMRISGAFETDPATADMTIKTGNRDIVISAQSWTGGKYKDGKNKGTWKNGKLNLSIKDYSEANLIDAGDDINIVVGEKLYNCKLNNCRESVRYAVKSYNGNHFDIRKLKASYNSAKKTTVMNFQVAELAGLYIANGEINVSIGDNTWVFKQQKYTKQGTVFVNGSKNTLVYNTGMGIMKVKITETGKCLPVAETLTFKIHDYEEEVDVDIKQTIRK